MSFRVGGRSLEEALDGMGTSWATTNTPWTTSAVIKAPPAPVVVPLYKRPIFWIALAGVGYLGYRYVWKGRSGPLAVAG